ncbi:MAG: OmpH family outer membrane protein [Gemmatimonadota bacterium]
MRRSTLIPAGFLFLVLLLGVEAQAQTAPRFAYIDSEAILQEAPGAQEAQQAFEQDMNRFREEVQGLAQELQELITRFESQTMMSPEARGRREQEIREKQQQYQQRIEELENQAAARQAELVEPIMDRITQVIETLRAEGNYSIIFDAASRSFIAADPELDLTAEVLRRLRADTAGR